MNTFKILIAFTFLMALYTTIALANPKNNKEKQAKKGQELETIDSYRGSSPFLKSKKKHHYNINPYKSWGGHNARPRVTCDWFPRVCHVKGSPGTDCCWKKCVNVKTDNLNCGMCGRRCRYPETCCNGRCVNSRYDRKHCGGCNNKCTRGNFCYNGMCNYS